MELLQLSFWSLATYLMDEQMSFDQSQDREPHCNSTFSSVWKEEAAAQLARGCSTEGKSACVGGAVPRETLSGVQQW